jgi:hypothetical protein
MSSGGEKVGETGVWAGTFGKGWNTPEMHERQKSLAHWGSFAVLAEQLPEGDLECELAVLTRVKAHRRA